MVKSLNQVLARLPKKRRSQIERRVKELVTLKDLRQAVVHTQEDLAVRLGVGQDTISRIERRSDLLLSTLRRYIQAMGGELELVARFPNRPPVVIAHLMGNISASIDEAIESPQASESARHTAQQEILTAAKQGN